MFFSFLFERVRWDGSGNQTGRPSPLSASRRRAKPRRRNLPRLEMLEDRTVPSGGYLFRTFDIPGAAQGTQGLDINNLGHVAGRFFDANTAAHGFLGSSSLSILNDPNAANGFQQGTFVEGLNDQDQAVGGYVDANSFEHGFLFSQGQFTTLDEPNAVPSPPGAIVSGTEQEGINASGQIVGAFSDASGTAHGFLLSGGQYTTLDDPNAGIGVQRGTVAIGINTSGQITGWYADANGTAHGFLLTGGQYTDIDDPNAGTGFPLGTQAFRINDAGQIVGTYTDANKVSHGFLLSGGQFTTLDDPSAGNGFEQGTSVVGINNAGQIVGWYFDANFAVHGFLATPDPASSASSPASVGGGSANGLLAAAALTNATLADHQSIGTAGSFGVNRDGLGGTAPRQPTIIATVPRTVRGSGDSASGRVYVVSAAPASVGKHPDPVGALLEEGPLWSWK